MTTTDGNIMGFVDKRSQRGLLWHKRWLVLDLHEGELKCYKDSEVLRKPTTTKPKYTWSMQGATAYSRMDLDSKKKFVFIIQLANGTCIEWAAESSVGRLKWIDGVLGLSQQQAGKSKKLDASILRQSLTLSPAINVKVSPICNPKDAQSVPVKGIPPARPASRQFQNTATNKENDSHASNGSQSPEHTISTAITSPQSKQEKPKSVGEIPEQTQVPPALSSQQTALMEEAAALGSLAWNDEYQNLVEKSYQLVKSTDQAARMNASIVANSRIDAHVRCFLSIAKKWACRIIDEYMLPYDLKSVKPMVADFKSPEQVAYLMEGIVFTFANEFYDSSAILTAEEIDTYQRADMAKSKQVSHELHIINTINAIQVDSLCTPLLAIINYNGFRIRAMATMPIYDESTLLYGKCLSDQKANTSSDFFRSTKESSVIVQTISEKLHLKTNSTDRPLYDLRVYHQSGNRGRNNVTHLRGIFPIDLDLNIVASGQTDKQWESKIFRGEFLSHYEHALFPYSYRANTTTPCVSEITREEIRLTDDDLEKDQLECYAASKSLQQNVIPRFVRWMEMRYGGYISDLPGFSASKPTAATAVEKYEAAKHDPDVEACSYVTMAVGSAWTDFILTSDDLCQRMHDSGINLRYLGKVAIALQTPHLHNFAIIEMIARTAKELLGKELRAHTRNYYCKLQNAGLASGAALAYTKEMQTRQKELILNFLNLLVGKSTRVEEFLLNTLYPRLLAKYGVLATELPIAALQTIHIPSLLSTVIDRCGLDVNFVAIDFSSENPIKAQDFLGSQAAYKYSQIGGTPAHQLLASARGGVGHDPHKVSQRKWQNFTRGCMVNLTMRNEGKKKIHFGMEKDSFLYRRRILRIRNELIYAHLQLKEFESARKVYQEALASDIPDCAEVAQLRVLGCWIELYSIFEQGLMMPSTVVRKSVNEQYQKAVSILQRHLGLAHPLVLSAQLTVFLSHTLMFPARVLQLKSIPNSVVRLLENCVQFAESLFTPYRPITYNLIFILARCYEELHLAKESKEHLENSLFWYERGLEALCNCLEERLSVTVLNNPEDVNAEKKYKEEMKKKVKELRGLMKNSKN